MFKFKSTLTVCCAFAATALLSTPLLALPNPTSMPVLRSDGDPTNVVYALKGQLVSDVSSPAIYYQATATGTTGYVTLVNSSGRFVLASPAVTGTTTGNPNISGTMTILPAGELVLTGTAIGAVAGQVLVTGTSMVIYLTTTTGLIVKSGTVTTF